MKKKFNETFLKYWGVSNTKTCKSCRSRQELSNEYFLAKCGVDTAEKEPYKVWSFGWEIRVSFDIEPSNQGPCRGPAGDCDARAHAVRASGSDRFQNRSLDSWDRRYSWLRNVWSRVFCRSRREHKTVDFFSCFFVFGFHEIACPRLSKKVNILQQRHLAKCEDR